MELAEYLTAYQDYWSENLSKLLAIKASETVTMDAEMLIHLRSYGGSVCRLDKFYGRPRFGALVPLTAQCRLGQFETIDELQVQALRRAIEEQQRTSVEVDSANDSSEVSDD